MQRKTFAASVIKNTGVGDRQIRAICSTSTPDRVGDIMVAAGCDLANYKRNPVVLWQHDPDHPIGRADASINGTRLEALIEFAPLGASRKADEACALCKAGVVNTLSVGFEPTETEPIRGGGYKIIQWDLLEISVCSIPANPEAVVVQKTFAGRSYRGRSSWNSPETQKMIRECTMRHLKRVGEKQEGELLTMAQGTPHLGPVLKAMEIERALDMSRRLFGSDPHARREQREREIRRLRGE